MKRSRPFGVALLFFALLAPWLSGTPAVAEITVEDFWWLYGEADLEHATYAPAMEREITRSSGVEIVPLVEGRTFVADEALRIRYMIRMPFFARLDTENLSQETGPFEVLGRRFGVKSTITGTRDLERQEMTLVVRMAAARPDDTYTLPALSLPYSYDTVVGEGFITQKAVAKAAPLEFTKVPVRVRTLRTRHSGFLWDVFPCDIEIRAEGSFPVVDDAYEDFTPPPPFVLMGRQRTTAFAGRYRVIRWRLLVAVADISDQPYTLTMPPVTWQRESPGDGPRERRESPAPVLFTIRSLAPDDGRLRPSKGIITLTPNERNLLLVYPLRIFLTFGAAALLWALFLLRRGRMARQPAEIPDPSRPIYEYRPWPRALLALRLLRARWAYRRKPDLKGCGRLRSLLARRSVLEVRGKVKLSSTEACALTARELEELGVSSKALTEIRQLESRMEKGR